jgi:nucleotide-binding universal stress UspA family protein
MEMKKILVPTDFSKPARFAVEAATAIAKKSRAEIILLHVIETPSTQSFLVEDQASNVDTWEDRVLTGKLIGLSKKQLMLACNDIQKEGVSASFRLKIGNLLHALRSSITNLQADLVVMGTSGRSRLEEIIVGSNTEKVVRHAKCPVLTVHESPWEIDFKNIVYATSMDEDEKAFANVIINIQEMFGATLHLVRVNTPDNFKSDTLVRKHMETFAMKLYLRDYTLNVYSDFTEKEGIINFASSIDADLIAMATHGRSGLAHVIAGSIAEDVANHATKPVLTFVTGVK